MSAELPSPRSTSSEGVGRCFGGEPTRGFAPTQWFRPCESAADDRRTLSRGRRPKEFAFGVRIDNIVDTQRTALCNRVAERLRHHDVRPHQRLTTAEHDHRSASSSASRDSFGHPLSALEGAQQPHERDILWRLRYRSQFPLPRRPPCRSVIWVHPDSKPRSVSDFGPALAPSELVSDLSELWHELVWMNLPKSWRYRIERHRRRHRRLSAIRTRINGTCNDLAECQTVG